ncbi:MAG: DNA ligase D [Bacteroidota bacterium]|nr:DNA ligase D [Bacteroidota bacterium]
MTLNKYNQKRNFNATAEPKGTQKKSVKELIFVVQKHAASHLHYDFRLEMEGALKSWAVPKGPSLNPEDKRLAMMVEDHPSSYKDFEGNIPKGNYGAGNVIVWDNGTYTATEATNKIDAENMLLAGLKKGQLSFILNGTKLKGEFSLVKLKGKQENAWLLIKKKDTYASDVDVLKKNKSVISNITLEDMALKSATISPKQIIVKKTTKTAGKENSVAQFIKPMLADTMEKPFDDKNWLFEIKYDGYRTVAVIDQGLANLFSRNQLSFNNKFKSIADALKKIKHAVVLDGEVVIEDNDGRSDFQLLQNYLKTGNGNLKYYVFDILNLNGNDTRSLSLVERKELLKLLLDKQALPNVFYSAHILEKGISFYTLAIKNNLEGIMAKDGKSPYRTGKRSSEWLKIKITQAEEAIIIGITAPKGARNHFGAVLLAQYDGEELRYIGHCGTGFGDETLKDMYATFQSSFISFSPLNKKIKLNGKVQWIEPTYVCQVKYTEWTQDKHLRHPVFLGMRLDKDAKEVIFNKTIAKLGVNSKPKKLLPTIEKKESIQTENDFSLKIGKVNVHLTNQNKTYFPENGITKGDIVNYYKEVADFILPYLKDRPQSMNRFPNGINGQSFYHKDVDIEKIPEWLKTKKIFSESNKDSIDYLLCNDKATLLYMANLGCIEINPWNSRINHIENPDWMVIDLDPGNIDFKEVVKTALVTRQVMNELDTECYCKTSGATGLHVYIPLAANYDYDTVKIFAELIAHTVNLRLPETTSIVRTVKKRQDKIYIDFLQNRRGQTLAAPYSVRPKPGATVSTPLEWNEVNEKLFPGQFTIKNMLNRLDKKGDLWKPVIGKGVKIDKIIKKISEGSKTL